MQDVVVNLIRVSLRDHQRLGKPAARTGNQLGTNVPGTTYRCHPGGPNDYVFIFTQQQMWHPFLRAIGREDLIGDARYEAPEARWQRRDEVNGLVEAWTSERSKHEVVKILAGAGVPCGACLDTGEVMTDPHLRARDMIVEVEHPVRGKHFTVGNPIKLSASRTTISPAPLLGQHREESGDRGLAEDFATADILTKGRIVFGIGRGYHTREVETFGNPMLDADANRELFEEQVEIMLKAFREESFSHQGKHYTIPSEVPYRGYTLKDITLVPRPIHQPVEVWQPIVSGSARGLDFMARHGIKGVISATAEDFVGRWFRDYQEAAARHGRTLQLGEDLILGFRMSIDDTVEGAIAKARPYFEEHAKFMAPLGMLRYSEEHVKAVAARQAQSATAATLENGVRNRSWLCGPSRDIVAYLKEIEARYPGLDHVMIAWALSTPRDLMIQQLTQFAREVMPAFTHV